MKIKYLLFLALISAFLFSPIFASAVTIEELQVQIANLLKQIAQLQQQLAAAQGQPAVWCHDFNVNLGVGNSGDDVCALRTVLQKEGFETEDTACKFDEELASAVSGFQQKYINEILTPLGLKYGTGYVGKATRAKLNKLYGCGVKAVTPTPTITTPVCNIFLTCEGGYTSYNTGEKDSQGCPIIKCLATPTPIPIPAVPSVPTIFEQVKCVFNNSNSKQECYSSAGSSCAGIESCVADVKGAKAEQITWKSTCGGYVYTTLDGQNEYADFKCVLTPTAQSYITVLSPNGGEQWTKGSTQILQWRSSSDINTVYIKLRKGSDTYPGTEGVVSNMISNAGTNPGSHTWTIPTTLPDGNDYAIRIIDIRGTVLDDSDAPFSIVTTVSQNRSPKIVGVPAIPMVIQTSQSVNFPWSAQDDDNDDLVWQVNWGDGSTMTGACPASNLSKGQGWKFSPSHDWKQAGTYTVKTTVSDCKGGTDSQSFTVTVGVTGANLPPTISGVSGPNALKMYESGTWIVEASDSEQGILTYSVTWGDESLGAGAMFAPKSTTYTQITTFTHSYFKAGTYNPTFIVTDDKGLSAKTSISVNVGETTGIGFVRFELLDSSLCPPCAIGTVCAVCPPTSSMRIYNGKVTVYDEKGNLIGTKDTSSGLAVFENLPYGNYNAIVSASGFETDKLSLIIVGPNIGTDYSVNLKKSSTIIIPTITVLSPNGGESWTFGNTYGITWKSSGVKTAFVYLWFSDGTTCKLADVPAENGKYSVQFAENQLCTTQNISIKVTVGRYRIKIYTENEKVEDSSDNYFSIVSAAPVSTTPIVTVTYPNGGETWTKDMTYTVKWSVNGLFSQGSKRVILEKSGVSVLQYSGNAENADLFNLTLSSADIVVGKDYKIKVELVDTNGKVIASDTSDSYLSIVSAGTGLEDIENMLASISQAVSQIAERIKELMGR